MSSADYLAALFPISEFLIFLTRRAKAENASITDKGSLRKMWRIILMSIVVSIVAREIFPYAVIDKALSEHLALGLLGLGLTIRWYSILYLGRFFTVNVAITKDHQLVVSGPYKYVRHPSYSGLLIAFLGLGVLNNNWIGLFVLTVPVFSAIAYRVKVEESVMSAEFGASYQAYTHRTRKLIPLFY